jgi:hypothetical protein
MIMAAGYKRAKAIRITVYTANPLRHFLRKDFIAHESPAFKNAFAFWTAYYCSGQHE